jgi:hypothetical protein
MDLIEEFDSGRHETASKWLWQIQFCN